ncbi:MAG: hypothetical protein KGI27_06000 [Thaumarchaeota archaeon]|nr:hypothetical protein [Nitrososphaerota archaeon]
MSEDTVTVPRGVLTRLEENNRQILERLEKLSERLKPKNRKGFFIFSPF